MISEPIAVSLISAVSGIVIAYVVNVMAKRAQHQKKSATPVDQMERMFDGYDRLIRQKDAEDERKARLINELKDEIEMTRKMMKELESALVRSQEELERSRDENNELRTMLKLMREEYKGIRQSEE